MAEGINYVDSKQPYGYQGVSTGDFPAVTLSTTSKELVPAAIYSPTGGGNYWWQGKELRVRAFGKMTTVATPGNLTIEIRLATADAGGTIIATSAATALAANKTNISWTLDCYVECRALGTSTNGKLFGWGSFMYDGAAALFTTTSQNPLLIPASAAVDAGVDTSAASGISLQMKRSGSSAETVTVQDYLVQSVN